LHKLKTLKPKKPLEANILEDPPCVKYVVDNFTYSVKEMIALCSYVKDAKKNILDLQFSLKDENFYVLSAIKSEIEEQDLNFVCSYIRHCSVDVECEPEICESIGIKIVDIDEPIETDFQNITDAVYTDKLLKFDAVVISKNYLPYLLPTELTFKCLATENKPKCKSCPIFLSGGTYAVKVGEDLIPKLVDVDEKAMLRHIKEAHNLPSCQKLKTKVESHINLWDSQIVPNISFSPDKLLLTTEYLPKRIFFLGKDIKGNTYYDFVARLLPNPKDNSALLISRNIKEKMDELDINQTFNPEDFKIFQCDNNKEAIKNKIADKYHRLCHNFLKIYGRLDMFMAFEIAFHTPLGIIFNNEFTKGWADIIIVGDSGQGKTQMAERLIRFYNAGAIVSGESAKRTGLTWTIHQVGKRWHIIWGILPRCDRKLLVIDEFHELDEEDIERLRKENKRLRKEN
jgi:hypothetical protein